MDDRYHTESTLLHDSFARVASSHWVTSDDEAFFAGLSRLLLVKGNAFLGCGSHLSPPSAAYGRSRVWCFSASSWMASGACWPNSLLHLPSLEPFFLAYSTKSASLRELDNLGGLRRNTHQDATQSQDFLTTYPPSPYSEKILSRRGLKMSVSGTSGLEVLSTQRLRRLSVAALQPVSAGALTFSWLSTGRQ